MIQFIEFSTDYVY